MKPPYQITSEILHLISSIAEKIGSINARHLYKAPAELRKSNRIKTIQSSLEIEGNTLSEEQITAILENKRVIAPEKDILEVKNAIEVYENLHSFKFDKLTSFCKAHQLLMKVLIADAGKIRSKSVGIIKGSQVAHLAPPGNLVQSLLNDLFIYLKNNEDLLLIKSCVFHYEFEFIHPFMDGNGRMGRLWQTLILKEYSPVFGFLPIESIIKNKQAEYYQALNKSDKSGSSTPFITFMLHVIDQSLNDLIKSQRVTLSGNDRMNIYKDKIGSQSFTRQNYMHSFPDISTATASRDLKDAVNKALLIKQGDKNKTAYQFQ